MIPTNVIGEHGDKKNAGTCVNSYTATDAVVFSILVLRRAGKWEKI